MSTNFHDFYYHTEQTDIVVSLLVTGQTIKATVHTSSAQQAHSIQVGKYIQQDFRGHSERGGRKLDKIADTESTNYPEYNWLCISKERSTNILICLIGKLFSHSQLIS